ncbi:MAG: hypothetical protein LUH58_03315 [Lachnospiraceae bacterium]|nr:hypothetical protein [Lachnospiraceae bacterium]
MNFTTTYKDTAGVSRTVAVTEEDSMEAMKNDYDVVSRLYNPRYVTIQRVQAGPGEAMHLKVTVRAPSHYLTSQEDTSPKACQSTSVDIVVYPGYPVIKVKAYYPGDHYLASPNVFRYGGACIDEWIPFTSSLVTVVEKLVHDMIHDPIVTRYDSMANAAMEQWHKNGVAAGRFPTIAPKLLYAPEKKALPPRGTGGVAKKTITPLPPRRH